MKKTLNKGAKKDGAGRRSPGNMVAQACMPKELYLKSKQYAEARDLKWAQWVRMLIAKELESSRNVKSSISGGGVSNDRQT
jgi:hypothetical protein